jgi:hypothetical protein
MKINALNLMRLLFISFIASLTFPVLSLAEITSSINSQPILILKESLYQPIKIGGINVKPSYKVDRQIITSMVYVERNTEILDANWKKFYSNGKYNFAEIENVKKSSRKMRISLSNLLDQLKFMSYDQSDGKQVILSYANDLTDYLENIDKIVGYLNRRIAGAE